MSFFNSVVSAVVGAVAAVANAIGSAVKSIVSAVSGNGSQAAGGIESAASGAMAIIADVFEDGEIDEGEEELLEEAFKLLVGAFIFPFNSGSSSAEIDSNENTCKNEPTLWSKTCNLGAGVLDGAKGTLDGLANMVKHPIDTINSARSFAENPEYAARVGKAIWKEIKDEYKRDVIDGDANSESYFTGRVLFEGALLFGPTVTKLNKSEKIGKASEAISEAEKITEGVRQSVSVNANEIRFSQSSVNGADEIISSMKANGWKGDPIDVIKMNDGKLTTIDNTRVVAAREAGIDVQAIIHDANELLPENLIDRFTTKKGIPKTWGEAIELRIGKQKASFRNNNQFGADTMERIGK